MLYPRAVVMDGTLEGLCDCNFTGFTNSKLCFCLVCGDTIALLCVPQHAWRPYCLHPLNVHCVGVLGARERDVPISDQRVPHIS